VVRFSGCSLDAELLGLLRAGLTESTIQTFHLDWNPLEIPLGEDAIVAARQVQIPQDVDDLEREREKQQTERNLQSFREELEVRHSKPITDVIAYLSDFVDPEYPATRRITPLSLTSWISVFSDGLGVQTKDSQRTFDILDQPPYGPGDGFVTLTKLQEVLLQLPPAPDDEQVNASIARPHTAGPEPAPQFFDVLGSPFAKFIDASSPLEMASFRCCNLARLEARAIAASLAVSPHLRALNLWGNRMGDRAAKYLAQALEYNFGLLFLGLGNNLITHLGLETLCRPLGTTILHDKKECDKLSKLFAKQAKDIEKQQKNAPPPPRDANDRERYTPAPHVDSIEESTDSSGAKCWIWTRNTVLKTLNVERCPIADDASVLKLQPRGKGGSLILRSTPCAKKLLEPWKNIQLEAQSKAQESAQEGEAAPEVQITGWTLILE
jgi:hypothetical protein